MRGLVFTVDAILALSVITATLLVANAFSNTEHANVLAMHVAARDVATLQAKGITLPDGMASSVTLNKSEITGGSIINSANKRFYSVCECNTQMCDLRGDSACLDLEGTVETIESWSVK